MRSHCTIRPAPIAIIVAILTIASPSIHAQSMSPRAIALAVDAAMRGLGGTSYKARFVRVRPGGDTVVLEGEVYFNPAPDRGTLGGDLLIETSDSVRYTFDGTDVAILDRHAHRITLGDVTTDAPMLIASGRHSSLIPGLIRSKDTLSKIVVLGIDCAPSDSGSATRVMLQSGAAYGTLFGGMHITRRYKVELFPSLYIIGRDGTVRYTHRGNSEELEGEVAAAIEGIIGER
jgi:hypothetical protein